METLGNIWFALGVFTMLIWFVTTVVLIVQAFRQSVAWGLSALFIPFALVLFAVLNWERSRRPFLVGLMAFAAFVLELMLASAFQAVTGV